MKTELEQIKDIISTFNAFEYAEILVQTEKKHSSVTQLNIKTNKSKAVVLDYEDYMKQVWSTKKEVALEECIEASRNSKLNEYAKLIQMYTGWIQNGRLFVLNKAEKFVSFIYEIKKDGYTLNAKPKTVICKTHYNPLNVDCIEENISAKHLSETIINGGYEISKDEKYLIKECDKLINV